MVYQIKLLRIYLSTFCMKSEDNFRVVDTIIIKGSWVDIYWYNSSKSLVRLWVLWAKLVGGLLRYGVQEKDKKRDNQVKWGVTMQKYATRICDKPKIQEFTFVPKKMKNFKKQLLI